MENLSTFCTCTDKDCPLHPTNHDKGCAPCIAKNLKNEEVPNCFFNLVDGTEKRDSYQLKDFAEAVLKQDGKKSYSEDKISRAF